MSNVLARFRYLLTSTRGLILLATGLIALVTAIFGMLSGPMAELGLKEIVVGTLGMDLNPAEREGRIVTLYHSIAIAVVAVLVYFITETVPMKASQRIQINGAITFDYLATMIGGLGFGYFGHNWLMHGLYISGMAVTFYAGCLLAVALWPWRPEYRVQDPAYAHTRSGTDLERVAFFAMAVATLGSAAFGAAAGMFYGNGFQTFLAEDAVRESHHSILEYAVIGHLHIMLALIAVAVALIIGRWFDFRGFWHKLAMPFMILGIIMMTLGVWGIVTPLQPIAHTIIYVGATPSMLAGLFLVIFGFERLIRDHLASWGVQRAGLGIRLRALLADPLRFGTLWQMLYMNFVVSGVGIFMAIRLDEIFRVWPAREERISLTGHWHVLSGIIGTILLLRFADMMGLKGRVRQWFGWTVIIGSDLAFAAADIFALKRLWVDEYNQQPLVDVSLLLVDIGLVTVLAALAAFLVWRLADLFRRRGAWAVELAADDAGKEVAG